MAAPTFRHDDVSSVRPRWRFAGCAGGPPEPARVRRPRPPAYRVGDRWVYHGDRRLSGQDRMGRDARGRRRSAPMASRCASREGPDAERRAHRVVVGAGAGQGRRDLRQRDATLRGAARSATIFRSPAGKVWNQWVDNYNEATKESGQINRYVRVQRVGQGDHAGGTFDAISMQVFMRLDDETFWR